MKVSVAMCTYNGAPFLREQLASISAQSRPPDELIIVDDCSNDSTLDIIRDWADQSKLSIRLEINQQNIGSTRNFEKAIRLCSGDIIALCDQDDVWLPNKLETIEKCFNDSPATGVVFSDAEIIDDGGARLGRRLWQKVGFGHLQRELVEKNRALDVLLPCRTVTGTTMAFRSQYVNLVLPVPESPWLIHDGWITLVIAAIAKADFIDEPLVLYRQHERQQIGVPKNSRYKTRPPALPNRINVVNSYQPSIDHLELLIERLSNRDDVNGIALRRRLKHLKTRNSLQPSVMKRVVPVLSELVSSRYHAYSNGFASAARDLFTTPASDEL